MSRNLICVLCNNASLNLPQPLPMFFTGNFVGEHGFKEFHVGEEHQHGREGNGLVVATTVYDIFDDGNIKTSTVVNASLTT
ncbi:MAG: hypothetical protein KF775_17990 [Cyclobacteriaceae bacterium]|nr:hypothetical protein [Cyclobacteriaceae bacterium]